MSVDDDQGGWCESSKSAYCRPRRQDEIDHVVPDTGLRWLHFQRQTKTVDEETTRSLILSHLIERDCYVR
jgi:hypothetical protein